MDESITVTYIEDDEEKHQYNFGDDFEAIRFAGRKARKAAKTENDIERISPEDLSFTYKVGDEEWRIDVVPEEELEEEQEDEPTMMERIKARLGL